MVTDRNELIERLHKRQNTGVADIQKKVDAIIDDVKLNGDKALFSYTRDFDGVALTADTVRVTEDELSDAFAAADAEFIEVIRKAAERIESYHEKQRQNSWFSDEENGEILGQVIRPLESVGIYVPGGKAAYPSSVLMNAIPAKIAGVKNIYLATPPMPDGKIYEATLVAAKIAGVTDIYKMGGAQAVAAFAYGTETINRVDKITGPGNIYVALAKKSVFGQVGIDSIAGPSEILVIADETANPVYVAADLLSQAEHDELASAVLITTCAALPQAVMSEIIKQTEALPRKKIIEKSLDSYGAMIVVETIDEAIGLSNIIAPEHLEICTREPFSHISKIKNAGAVFLGHYSPEPLGDYFAGPNHVLPTGGTARFFSPLGVSDFVKKMSLISFDKEAFAAIGGDVIKFAEAEGLNAHANAVRVRF